MNIANSMGIREFKATVEATKRKHKFAAIPTMVDGIRFDSQKEAHRYSQLVILQKSGEVRNLQRQVPFKVDINGRHVFACVYDFTYELRVSKPTPDQVAIWRFVIEDTKGMLTPEYKIKKRVFEAATGYTVQES